MSGTIIKIIIFCHDKLLLCILYHVAVRDFTADIHKALIQRVELGITEYCKYNWKTTVILLSSKNNFVAHCQRRRKYFFSSLKIYVKYDKSIKQHLGFPRFTTMDLLENPR